MLYYVILVLLFAVLIAAFAIQNNLPVPIRFFGWQFETSLVMVILGTTALGAVIVGLLSILKQIGMSMKSREQQGKIRKLEAELQTMKERQQSLELELKLAREVPGPMASDPEAPITEAESRDSGA